MCEREKEIDREGECVWREKDSEWVRMIHIYTYMYIYIYVYVYIYLGGHYRNQRLSFTTAAASSSCFLFA